MSGEKVTSENLPVTEPPEAVPLYLRTHDEAVLKGKDNYLDPKTGYMVFTRLKHLERGYCCDSGCRHCPYNKKIV